MNSFFIYPTIGVLCMIPAYIESNFLGVEYSQYLLNFSLLFHYLFLGIFIFKVLPKRSLIFIIILIVFFLFIVYMLFFSDWNFLVNKAFAVTNFSLTALCLVYYFQILKLDVPFLLKNEPSFWIITGIFIGMGSASPLSAIIDYLAYDSSVLKHQFFYKLVATSYTIMHLFFIKGYLCSIKERKV